MIKLAVVGNPVLHSLSPEVFRIFGESNPEPIYYNRISANTIDDVFLFLEDIELAGLNVTSPFKTEILDKLGKIDYQAANLNSANTVLFQDGMSIGFNSDYFGILKTIWDNKFIFNKQKVLILGAGAAGRTAAYATRNLNSIVFIWDRNPEKANKLAREAGIQAISSEQMTKEIGEFQYIVSTIPQNSEIFNNLVFSEKNIIFDTVYHNSFFKRNREKYGYQLIPGENWLINQATLSYEIFFGNKPEKIPEPSHLENIKNQRPNVFILIGFSGSGKTTLAKEVAQKNDMDYFDIDEMIELKQKKSISEIFSTNGESYFRQLENQTLNSLNNFLQNRTKPTMISTGGGILTNPDNLSIIKKMGFVIWIYTPFQTMFKRIDQNNRPLIKNYDQSLDLYNSRKEDYFINSNGIFINNTDFQTSVNRLSNEIKRLYA